MKGKDYLFKGLLILISLTFASSIYSTDQFPIGVYDPPPESLYGQVDSCGFNIIVEWARTAQLDSAYNWGLKVINTKSWHAQGNQQPGGIWWPVSAQYIQYESEDELLFSYETGSEIDDPSASGGRALIVEAGIDSPGYLLHELGRPIDQKYRDYQNNHFYITFRIKVDDNTGSDTVATIRAIRYESGSEYVEAENVLMVEHFESPDIYLDFPLEFDSDEEESDSMDYRVYWHGYRTLWADYVLAQDSNAVHLFAHEWDDSITNYIEDYQGYPATFRWYLCDEPNIDQYPAQRYVDSLIKTVNTEHPGITALCYAWGDCELFVNQTNPHELLFDHYPITTAVPTPGNSGYNNALQAKFDELSMWVMKNKKAADMGEIPFWFVTQVHSWYSEGLKDPDPALREPTPEEIRAMANLALAYGAQGVFYYRYTSKEAVACTGLVDTNYVPNAKWYEVRRINSILTSLGPTLLNLTWDSTFTNDAIPPESYIDFVSGEWIEIGIFEDALTDTNYFMLVNRKCDTTQARKDSQTVTVQTNRDGQWMIEDVLTKEKYATSDGTFRNILLPPGDGRLFKLRQLFVGDEQWGGTVHMSDSIHIPYNKTLVLDSGTAVKFARYASLDAGGELVAIGTQSDSISFTGDTDNPYPGYWEGMTLFCTDTLSYCRVSYASVGIHAYGEAKSSGSVIQHSRIDSNQTHGISCGNSSTITDNYITANNTTGIYCSGSYASPLIRGNTISNNPKGIKCRNSANPDIGNQAIGDPGNNRIQENTWNFYNETPDTIMAEGNWWGAIGEEFIDSLIYDDDECGSCGPVDFDPWLRNFVRGDANNDKLVTFADALYIYNYYYHGDPPPSCMDAGDADDDDQVHYRDALYIWRFFYQTPPGSPPPPPPYPNCGLDPTSDTLVCESHQCDSPHLLAGQDMEFGGSLSLGEFMLKGDELIVPVHLANVETVSAFDWKAEYNPALITPKLVDNKGLITEDFDFFIVCRNDEEGWIRTGALLDSTLARNLPPRKYQIANMIFTVNRAQVDLEGLVRLTDGELIYLHKSFAVQIGDGDGGSGAMSATSSSRTPYVFMLLRNRPNPFGENTQIEYSLPKTSSVSLNIYDISGRLIRTLVDGRKEPGHYTVHWNGKNDDETLVPSGVYFYRIVARCIDGTEGYKMTKKMLLLR